MKKLVLASLIALVGVSLVTAPTLKAQDASGGTITIKDPVEFQAYQNATTQSDPKAKAAALESFLTTYPQRGQGRYSEYVVVHLSAAGRRRSCVDRSEPDSAGGPE
jgi:hypothetical protein